MTLQARLSTLESSGLVQVAADYPELEYLFRHTLIQEAAYESMLKQDRKQLHLAVGEALERSYPDRLEESDGLLAYHYSRAEVWDKTFAHAWAAARRAKRLYASAEALAYYDLALTALSQLNEGTADDGEHRANVARRFDLLSERHGVSTLTGRFERSKADLEDMVALARQMGDDARLSDALTGLSNLYFTIGPMSAGRSALEEALAAKRRLGDKRGQADCLNLLTGLYCGLGQIEEGLAAYAESRSLNEALGDRDGLARNEWIGGAVAYGFVGDYEGGLGHLQQSLALSREAGNRALEAGSLLMVGAANVAFGDYEAGRSHLEQAMEIARPIGDHPTEGWAWLYLSWADRETAQFDISFERAQRALAVGRSAGEQYLTWYTLYSLARLSLVRGNFQDALPHANDAYGVRQRKLLWPLTLVCSLSTLARVHNALGYVEEARRMAGDALRELGALNGRGVPGVQGVYFDCYLTMRAAGAPEAGELLQKAHAAMMHEAGMITDPARRERFLSHVAMNREVVEEWKSKRVGK